MEVGIGLPTTIPGVTGEQVLEWARRAEARGFSSLGTIDRIVYPNYEPLIALAAAAAVTERIRLATSILIAPNRANGALLAKQAATLDHLSGGRLVLGLAVGGREDDYAVSGVDFHSRGRLFAAMLAADGAPVGRRAVEGGGPSARSRRAAVRRCSSAAARTWPSSAPRATATAGSWAAARPTHSRRAREKLEAAWQAAGRDGTPRTAALAYYALGDGAQEAANAYLRDYYAFLGDYAGMVADSAATDADTVRGYVQAFDAAGCDELILFPSDPDPGQVDLLADAVFHSA